MRLRLVLLFAIALTIITGVLASPAGAAGSSYQLTDLGTLGGSFSSSSGLSGRGSIIGQATLSAMRS